MSSNDHSWRRKTQSYLKWYISVAIEGNVVHGSRPRVSSSELSWYQAHKDRASWRRHLGLWWTCNRRDAATAARDSQHRLSMMLVIVLSSATERTISLDSIKLYSAAVVGEQTVEKRKMQWWIYLSGQHSRFWIAAVCALQSVKSGLLSFAGQRLFSKVFSVLVFMRSHRTIHEFAPGTKPVPCRSIVHASVIVITSINPREASLIALLMHGRLD